VKSGRVDTITFKSLGFTAENIGNKMGIEKKRKFCRTTKKN
jgi:hypothetical protein